MEILSVAFCGPCAREQEAYFAIGELMDEAEEQDLRSEPLAAVLKMMRRVRAGSSAGITARMHHGLSGVDESESLALSKG